MPTYKEIAEDFAMWQQYVDPDTIMSEREFHATDLDNKVALIVQCFGEEIPHWLDEVDARLGANLYA